MSDCFIFRNMTKGIRKLPNFAEIQCQWNANIIVFCQNNYIICQNWTFNHLKYQNLSVIGNIIKSYTFIGVITKLDDCMKIVVRP